LVSVISATAPKDNAASLTPVKGTGYPDRPTKLTRPPSDFRVREKDKGGKG